MNTIEFECEPIKITVPGGMQFPSVDIWVRATFEIEYEIAEADPDTGAMSDYCDDWNVVNPSRSSEAIEWTAESLDQWDATSVTWITFHVPYGGEIVNALLEANKTKIGEEIQDAINEREPGPDPDYAYEARRDAAFE